MKFNNSREDFRYSAQLECLIIERVTTLSFGGKRHLGLQLSSLKEEIIH